MRLVLKQDDPVSDKEEYCLKTYLFHCRSKPSKMLLTDMMLEVFDVCRTHSKSGISTVSAFCIAECVERRWWSHVVCISLTYVE